MCLTVDESKTQKLHKEKPIGKITVWKVYRVTKYSVFSPICNTEIYPGKIVSDRSTRIYPSTGKDRDWVEPEPNVYVEVTKGIHVFFTREAARKYRKQLLSNCCEKWYKDDPYRFIIVKCEGDMKDFVATGSTRYGLKMDYCRKSAVFMKIYISPEEFEKGKKGRN